ncbi:GNAT family N-acetyltransferase [Georgenia sp. H159]|uniref:GNAT family N-acetyltransferase n=1 Tax=Georgenia sp. H159 TaxID=3076115 RepID=UPI002D765E7B|nr:GNAT family N-acetyltransferase [Georgenia sp. H159]
MDLVHAGGRPYRLARAVEADVPAVVALLADDVLGADRETGELARYLAAFRRIDEDPKQLLVVVRDDADAVVGTLQLTLIPGLARAGATRLQVEAVRLSSRVRGTGLGTAVFAWVHEYGRRHGADLVQLTSDRSRRDAHRFYERLGYLPGHVGFKLTL